MSESTYKSFAVVGGNGIIGKPVIQGLLAHNVSVLILTRPSSSATFPSGAKVVQVDYSDEPAVASALRENGVEVLVSTLGSQGLDFQTSLAKASKAAGVKLFVPSEYGMPTEGGTDGFVLQKSNFAAKLREIGLPSLRLYNGLFMQFIPFVAAVKESGKFLIVGAGNTPVSFTASEDIGGFLVHVLLTLPPSKLNNAVFRIQGQRATLTEISKLFGDKAPVQYVDSIPTDIPLHQARDYLQRKFDLGAGSTGWDAAAGKEGDEPAGSANVYWEGHQWKGVKEVLGL
ncbi:NAD(P)-binding protein [Leucogyrophana mollusca]|uniref:NAD(P)-binding protein n=1 Tax=Leucogyrophana mollusca TaxID=85980 RepID=A0ACB8B9R1_9AGAM|nr:NAD(P)-binding protein [Leucogyrophana mollusca]